MGAGWIPSPSSPSWHGDGYQRDRGRPFLNPLCFPGSSDASQKIDHPTVVKALEVGEVELRCGGVDLDYVVNYEGWLGQ